MQELRDLRILAGETLALRDIPYELFDFSRDDNEPCDGRVEHAGEDAAVDGIELKEKFLEIGSKSRYRNS